MLNCKYWDCGWCYVAKSFRGGCVGFNDCALYEPRGEKMKRYRLKIPEMIHRKDASLYHFLCKHALISKEQIITDDLSIDGFVFRNIPKEWLEEIKDEPMSPEEWVTTARFPSPPPNQYPAYLRVLKNVFEAGAAENEKKHQLQQSFDGWLNGISRDDSIMDCQDECKLAWQAHAEATNTEA